MSKVYAPIGLSECERAVVYPYPGHKCLKCGRILGYVELGDHLMASELTYENGTCYMCHNLSEPEFPITTTPGHIRNNTRPKQHGEAE